MSCVGPVAVGSELITPILTGAPEGFLQLLLEDCAEAGATNAPTTAAIAAAIATHRMEIVRERLIILSPQVARTRTSVCSCARVGWAELRELSHCVKSGGVGQFDFGASRSSAIWGQDHGAAATPAP